MERGDIQFFWLSLPWIVPTPEKNIFRMDPRNPLYQTQNEQLLFRLTLFEHLFPHTLLAV